MLNSMMAGIPRYFDEPDDKASVDKAMADTQSKGFDVVVKSATVKGRQYRCLQVAGFESLAAAKTAAEPINESR